MKIRSRVSWIVVAVALMAGGAWWWHDDRATRFLPGDTTDFVRSLAEPLPADSPTTRAELAELLSLQSARTEDDVAAARADRKTEVTRFYGALGLDATHPPKLPRVERLAERVEDDVRIYVRAAKAHFLRLRPYEIESRLDPCIGDVKGDRSYPSGHAAFAWAMAGMLSDLVPERRTALQVRATEYARQRMVCGVHFPSDLEAGRQAAEWILREMRQRKEYSAEAAEASLELRQALRLPVQRPTSVNQ